MGFWQKLFGRGPRPTPTSFGQSVSNAAPTLEDGVRLAAFLAGAPLDESQRNALIALIGSSPQGMVDHHVPSAAWPDVISRIRKHIDGPYPVKAYKNLPDRPAPDYRMVDGKVARASNLAFDAMLITVMPRTRSSLNAASPPALVGHFIQTISEWPLSKLVFYLPRFAEGTLAASTGKPIVMVIEDLFIQAHRGVENILFGLYDDLPEGGLLSDEAVVRKLWTLIDGPDTHLEARPRTLEPLTEVSAVHTYPAPSTSRGSAGSEDGWFVVIRGNQFGPFSLAELKSLTAATSPFWVGQTPMVRSFMAEWQHQPKASVKRGVRGRLCNVRNIQGLQAMYPEVVDCFPSTPDH